MSNIRPIEGFPNYYISDDGRVFSTQKWNDGSLFRELKQEKLKHGYRRVTIITVGGTRTRFLVHRLVAQTFIANPDSKFLEVRHLDGNPANNKVQNLAWGTHVENSQDSIAHGTIKRGSASYNSILTEQQVTEIKQLVKNRRYPDQRGAGDGKLTYKQIGEMYGVTKGCVANIATRSWKHV